MGDTLVRDSTSNKASYFSVSAGIEHDFYLYNVFSKNDELDIIPSVVINSGSDNLTTTQLNKVKTNLPPRIASRLKRTTSANNKFQLQSIAAALDVTYTIGKFFVQPSLYAGYYLPSTTSNRFTAIYSLTVGLSF